MKRVQVQLFGANGNHRSIEVNPRVKTESITVTPDLPTPTPQAPKQPLKELLQEVDAAMNPKPTLSEGQEIILKALRKSTDAQDLESIEYMTGLNSLYILLACRELAELGFVEIVSTLTVRKFRASRKGTEGQNHDV